VPAVVSALPHTSPGVSCVYGQLLISTASPHTPHSSSQHFFSQGVCANTQLLGGAAVVNNIYVPPLRALSSAVSQQVSAIIRRPVITPRVVLNPCAPSFQPRVAQLDPTSSVHSNPAASLGVIVDPLPDNDSALQPTAFTPSLHPPVPYSHPEPDEPKPPDILHSRSSADAPVLSAVADASVVGEDPELPENLRELFDEIVERSQPTSSTLRRSYAVTVRRSPPVRWTSASVMPFNMTSRRETPSRSSSHHDDPHSPPGTRKTSSSTRCWRQASLSPPTRHEARPCAWSRRKMAPSVSA